MTDEQERAFEMARDERTKTPDMFDDLALVFYGHMIERYQDAHITVSDVLPDLANLLRQVFDMAIPQAE